MGKNMVFCPFCGADFDKAKGNHICEPDVIEIQLMEMAEFGPDTDGPSESELSQQLADIRRWESTGNGHIRVSPRFPDGEFVVKSWGGPRLNAGGARPNSGPLRSRIPNFHPFAHGKKGRTYSQVSIYFERCNKCGAIGWSPEQGEQLYRPDAPEGESYAPYPPQSVADRPLVHSPTCNQCNNQ